MRLLVMGCVVVLALIAVGADGATVRQYYIAAEDVRWDFAPTDRNLVHCMGTNPPCAIPAPWDRSHVFPAKRYIQYTDDTFTSTVAQPEWLGILGPIIRAEVGDTIRVRFCNRTRSGEYGMHPHGLRYTKDHEGASYFGANTGAPPGAGAGVQSGRCFQYVWTADEESGPGPNEPSSKVWWYHSHVHEAAEINSGLLGPIIVTRAGAAKPDGSPTDVAREFVTAFMIFDKADGKERGRMHSINGYIFGNLRGLAMKNGERVRWHVLGMGNEVDVHSAHWHGKTVLVGAGAAARRTDVLELMPASMITADMLADNPGEWMFHCHVADHIDAGMFTTYRIEADGRADEAARPVAAVASPVSPAPAVAPASGTTPAAAPAVPPATAHTHGAPERGAAAPAPAAPASRAVPASPAGPAPASPASNAGPLPKLRPAHQATRSDGAAHTFGPVTRVDYDGVTDDLLTAGLGAMGLAALSPPPPANIAAPTPAELRRIAIFNNYRALLDISRPGGYGTLYGPNIDADGRPTPGEGRIAGTEYTTYVDDGSGRENVTVMVQVPRTFNRLRPCIVAAASSGSRGIYGAIGSAGEWGLKRGCAVAYTDKGTGIGVHDLASNTVNLQNGLRAHADAAGRTSNFTVPLPAAELAAYNATFPNRVAFKHAMSQRNPEQDWGRHTLDAVRFAFRMLNEHFADTTARPARRPAIRPDNTIVIASSVASGGGAAIAAAEQDTEGLIDGVAVSEPLLELMPEPRLTIRYGSTSVSGGARPLFDYVTLANLYQPCASLSKRVQDAYGAEELLPREIVAANRCSALRTRGLLYARQPPAQAEESLAILLEAGWLPDSNLLHPTHYTAAVPAIASTYAYAYGRFGVTDNVCGHSFAALNAFARPQAVAAVTLAQIFGTGTGIVPSSSIVLINNDSVGGATLDSASITPSTGDPDFNIDGAVCLRELWTGSDASAERVRRGVAETLRTGNLRGKPVIIVAGRADALLPVNFNARPYFGLNRMVERAASRLVYIEVTNAQHFDAFIGNFAFRGYDTAFVPLHYYHVQAMDRMWAHLTQRAPLPPSQVVRTVPRGGIPARAPAITQANVPPIAMRPAREDRITFAGNVVTIPE